MQDRTEFLIQKFLADKTTRDEERELLSFMLMNFNEMLTIARGVKND